MDSRSSTLQGISSSLRLSLLCAHGRRLRRSPRTVHAQSSPDPPRTRSRRCACAEIARILHTYVRPCRYGNDSVSGPKTPRRLLRIPDMPEKRGQSDVDCPLGYCAALVGSHSHEVETGPLTSLFLLNRRSKRADDVPIGEMTRELANNAAWRGANCRGGVLIGSYCADELAFPLSATRGSAGCGSSTEGAITHRVRHTNVCTVLGSGRSARQW